MWSLSKKKTQQVWQLFSSFRVDKMSTREGHSTFGYKNRTAKRLISSVQAWRYLTVESVALAGVLSESGPTERLPECRGKIISRRKLMKYVDTIWFAQMNTVVIFSACCAKGIQLTGIMRGKDWIQSQRERGVHWGRKWRRERLTLEDWSHRIVCEKAWGEGDWYLVVDKRCMLKSGGCCSKLLWTNVDTNSDRGSQPGHDGVHELSVGVTEWWCQVTLVCTRHTVCWGCPNERSAHGRWYVGAVQMSCLHTAGGMLGLSNELSAHGRWYVGAVQMSGLHTADGMLGLSKWVAMGMNRQIFIINLHHWLGYGGLHRWVPPFRNKHSGQRYQLLISCVMVGLSGQCGRNYSVTVWHA